MSLSRTFARLSILALLASLFFAPPLSASASGTCEVNDYGDTAGTSSDRTLRYCITNVGDDGTITFDTSTAETITVSTSALLINSGGITIDGGGLITLTTTAPSTSTNYQSSPTSYPLVTVDLTTNTSAATTFKGLTFTGATNTSTSENNAPVAGSAQGGAINAAYRDGSDRPKGFDLVIQDSTFSFNRAKQGGAIAAENVTISGSSFVGNQSTSTSFGAGGAVLADQAVISNSYFESNTSPNGASSVNDGEGSGGAVWVESWIDINNSSFKSNSAKYRGGAVYDNTSLGDLKQPSQISGSFFQLNTVSTATNSLGFGGAVFFDAVSNGAGAIVGNSTFIENEAEQGAGISAEAAALVVVSSTFFDNVSDLNTPSISLNAGKLFIASNMFLASASTGRQVFVRSGQANAIDGGANISTGAASSEPFGADSLEGFDVSLLGIDVASLATPSNTVQPFLPMNDLSASGLEFTQTMETAFTAAYNSFADSVAQTNASTPDYVFPLLDQQGNTRTFPMYPGAEFGTSVVPQAPPSSSAAPAPYTGPLVTSIGSQQSAGAFQTTSAATVTVYGERLSGVNKVFIEGKEAVITSTSNDSFVMTLPEGLTDGVHDLVIQSSLGNLTYLDGISIAGETVEVFSYGEVSAWTSRISDTQLKVYVKYPTVGEKVRISHQVGGNGDYNTVYVKTTSSETMDGLRIVEGVGTYVVRTIDLEEINRIRVTVGDEELVQVRYNN